MLFLVNVNFIIVSYHQNIVTVFVYSILKLIRPRAEFLMAVGYDPLFKGVKFLVNSDIDEFTSSVGVQKDAFEQFKVKLESVWISDKDVIGVGKSSKLNSNNLNATLSDSSKAELVDLFASVLDAT